MADEELLLLLLLLELLRPPASEGFVPLAGTLEVAGVEDEAEVGAAADVAVVVVDELLCESMELVLSCEGEPRSGQAIPDEAVEALCVFRPAFRLF